MTGRRRARPSRDRNGGYLLIEALATLALSALVLASLMALSATFLRAGDRAAARVERLETEQRAVATIAREIRGAARLRYAGDGGRFVFLGLPDRIVFATEAIQPNGLRAPVAVAYQAAEGGTLLRAEAVFPIGATRLGDIAFSVPRRLPVGEAAIRFAYVGRTETGAEIVTESWDQPAAMPAAVRIDRVSAGDGRLLGSLRAALIVSAEPGCAAPDQAFCSRAPKAAPAP